MNHQVARLTGLLLRALLTLFTPVFAHTEFPMEGVWSITPPNTLPWRFYEHTPMPKLPSQARHRIAIIIDDLGNQKSTSHATAQLPGAITLAILPFSPYARETAALGQAHDKELMLHVPMEPLNHHAYRDGLNLTMSEHEIKGKLMQMLESVPGVRGANNHMGSALTQSAEVMTWVMDELAPRQLYFIDSRTTDKTQALQQAQILRVPSARRDVFLDNSPHPEDIARQFETLLKLAKKRGSAIAIGHPYPATIRFLQTISERLEHEGIELVPVSELVRQPDLPTLSQTRHSNIDG